MDDLCGPLRAEVLFPPMPNTAIQGTPDGAAEVSRSLSARCPRRRTPVQPRGLQTRSSAGSSARPLLRRVRSAWVQLVETIRKPGAQPDTRRRDADVMHALGQRRQAHKSGRAPEHSARGRDGPGQRSHGERRRAARGRGAAPGGRELKAQNSRGDLQEGRNSSIGMISCTLIFAVVFAQVFKGLRGISPSLENDAKAVHKVDILHSHYTHTSNRAWKNRFIPYFINLYLSMHYRPHLEFCTSRSWPHACAV